MKILAVSDVECAALYDNFQPGMLDGYDLIISCGDLKAEYLTFLVTMARARLLYVRGNHDTKYAYAPPEGCDDIDGYLVEYDGLKIMGLGGCMRYNDEDNLFTERQMRRRVAKLSRAAKKCGGVDIVVTHAPPKGIGDMEDVAHQGFECFVKLIDEFQPAFFLHGHTHLNYGYNFLRERTRGATRVINVSERFTLDIPDKHLPGEKKGKLIYKTRRRVAEPMMEVLRRKINSKPL